MAALNAAVKSEADPDLDAAMLYASLASCVFKRLKFCAFTSATAVLSVA